jgi:hypothetical protein
LLSRSHCTNDDPHGMFIARVVHTAPISRRMRRCMIADGGLCNIL